MIFSARAPASTGLNSSPEAGIPETLNKRTAIFNM
jgi:hypothetical protein